MACAHLACAFARMTWLAFAPVLLLAVVVLYVPGLALGLAIGARRFTLWATAPAITVAFVSIASNLVQGDANGGVSDLFVRDRVLGTTAIASLTSLGAQSGAQVPRGEISQAPRAE